MDKTFTEAAESYVEHGGQEKYLGPIVDYFEGKSLGSIYPSIRSTGDLDR